MHKNTPLLALLLLVGTSAMAQVHMSYLWHMQQPIYWPERSAQNPNRIQSAKESNDLKFNGGNNYPNSGVAHPLNDLQDIFGKADRVAVYQYRAKDAVQSLLGHPEAGAQVNYSGCLMDNIQSLGNAYQWGYSPNWNSHNITARNWTTSGGNPRMDLTGFTYHHALSPLLSDAVLRMQIQAHKFRYNQVFGGNYSKGYWPAECSFSERIIKVLVEEGFEWTIVANSHLARTLNDYPINFGTSGCNISPPNKADKVSTNGNNWWSGQIDGRGGTFAAPYCYQAHKAKYVDPNTGIEHKIDVVPMADLLSYQNGFSLMGTSDIDNHIAPFNDPNHPSMVLFAHDGDNAWGGGFDYYNQSVPGLANAAASQGYVPTTIQQFLDDHPVPANDIVKVEDGSWVNAANDWGHPQFINWLWPLYNNSTYRFDPNGWTEDARNWAVLVANENHVLMAEDLSPTPLNIADVVQPNANSSLAEKAWHFLLPAYTSGYMYYGASLDMEVKQTIACNNASEYADQVINQYPNLDPTPPSVFIPQRFPYNPGGTGFGPIYGYQQVQNSSDFHVWTFAYDVEGIQTAVLKYRVDVDGENPLSSNQNETYAGGNEVGPWQSINMSMRVFPKTNVTNNPEIDFFVLPDYIANLYYAEITGLSDTLVDYYVEVTDVNGNVTKTPIQHVYVGTSSAGIGGGPGHNNPNLTWTPVAPNTNDTITITLTNQTIGGRLHWGVNENGNRWSNPISAYRPAGSFLFNGSGPAVQTPFSGPNAGTMTLKIGPFNDPNQAITEVNFVINYNNNSWDNNNGQDYHIPITVAPPPAYIDTTVVTACDSFYWPAADTRYYQSGTYNHSGSGGAISTLILEVLPSYGSTAQVLGNYQVDLSWNNTGAAVYSVSFRLEGDTSWTSLSAQTESKTLFPIAPGNYEYYISEGANINPSCIGYFTINCEDFGYSLNTFQIVDATKGKVNVFGVNGGRRTWDFGLYDGTDTLWADNRFSNRFIQLDPGSYTIMVKDNYNCYSSQLTTVTINGLDSMVVPFLTTVQNLGGGSLRPVWTVSDTNRIDRYQVRVKDMTGGGVGTLYQTYIALGGGATQYDITGLPPARYRIDVRGRVDGAFTNGVYSNYRERVVAAKSEGGMPSEGALRDIIHIYPNPTNDLLYVQAPQGSAFMLIDLNGKAIVKRKTEAVEETFDLTELAQGVYILEISIDGAIYRERLVKN